MNQASSKKVSDIINMTLFPLSLWLIQSKTY